MKKFTAYFGTDIAGSGTVTQDYIDNFILQQFVPRFQGFSVSEIIGYWEGIKERTITISINCEDEEVEEIAAQLELIAEVYCLECKQDCVMIETVEVSSTFIN